MVEPAMIVLDSSFLIAFHNTRDAHHEAAADTMQQLLANEWGPALLPEYVFLEVTTVLAARRDLQTAIAVGQVLLDAAEIELVPCSTVFAETFTTFRNQPPGANLSFADAAIVAIARDRDIEHIATFDSGFRSIPGLAVVPG
jgi:predicted nucleic acid-binding protein